MASSDTIQEATLACVVITMALVLLLLIFIVYSVVNIKAYAKRI